jgi:RHS repeat-associated protein
MPRGCGKAGFAPASANALSRASLQQLDQFPGFLALLVRVTADDSAFDAVIQVSLQHFRLDPDQRRADGAQLGQDVDAIAALLDHSGDAADLALYPVQAVEQFGRVFENHGELPAGRSADEYPYGVLGALASGTDGEFGRHDGRLTGYSKVILWRSYPLAYAYDVNGKVTQISYPSGRIVNIVRATDGKVTSVTTKANGGSAAVNVATGVTYAPFGPLTNLTFGNGLGLTNTYDQNYWRTRTQVSGPGGALLDLGFARDNDGRLGGVTDNAATGRSTTIAYSASGRLTAANGPWGNETYAYDASGNRIQDSLVVGGVTTTVNALTAVSSNQVIETTNGVGAELRGLTYRAGGDLSQDQHIGGTTYAYVYDAQKRLVEVDQNGVKAGAYTYDAFGARVVRQVLSANATDHYVFDPAGHLLGDYNGNTGAVLKEYIWIDDLPIAVVDSTSGTANIDYIHTGQAGEPLELTNAAKALVWNAYVNPFGAAQTFSTAQAVIDLRLPGQWSELETGGLSQNGMRDYDPSLGRYIEADPLGIGAGQNVYAYVDGDPLNDEDPMGLAGAPAIPVPAGGLGGLGELGEFLGPLALPVAEGLAILSLSGDTPQSQVTPKSKAGNCPTGKCPPCKPPAGTVRYRFDQVPPSKPHFPFPGDHYHIYTMNQDPVSCRCSWSKVTTDKPPPPGAQPF